MTKAAFLFLLFGLAGPTMAAAQELPSLSEPVALGDPAQQPDGCAKGDPSEVVVCGRSTQRYRIDPNVLAATRAAEAPTPKPPMTGDVPEAGCVGPNCGGGSYVPLIGMALTALKAVELAEQGDDWRDAFRTRPDQYKTYSREKARKGGVSIGISAGNK